MFIGVAVSDRCRCSLVLLFLTAVGSLVLLFLTAVGSLVLLFLTAVGSLVLLFLTAVGESSQLDLVVADHHISPSVLHRAKQLHVPLVSAEWIIQCLVCGRIRDSDAHPMYQHDYEVQL